MLLVAVEYCLVGFTLPFPSPRQVHLQNHWRVCFGQNSERLSADTEFVCVIFMLYVKCASDSCWCLELKKWVVVVVCGSKPFPSSRSTNMFAEGCGLSREVHLFPEILQLHKLSILHLITVFFKTLLCCLLRTRAVLESLKSLFLLFGTPLKLLGGRYTLTTVVYVYPQTKQLICWSSFFEFSISGLLNAFISKQEIDWSLLWSPGALPFY